MKVEEVKIGTPVTYYQFVSPNGQKLYPIPAYVISKPWTIGDNEVVCKLEGIPGNVPIRNIDKREIIIRS